MSNWEKIAADFLDGVTQAALAKESTTQPIGPIPLLRSIRGSSLGELCYDVQCLHRQLGFAVEEFEGDEGFLRVTDVRPTARAAGIILGDLIIAVNGIAVDIPLKRTAFIQIVESSSRPIDLKFFRW